MFLVFNLSFSFPFSLIFLFATSFLYINEIRQNPTAHPKNRLNRNRSNRKDKTDGNGLAFLPRRPNRFGISSPNSDRARPLSSPTTAIHTRFHPWFPLGTKMIPLKHILHDALINKIIGHIEIHLERQDRRHFFLAKSITSFTTNMPSTRLQPFSKAD